LPQPSRLSSPRTILNRSLYLPLGRVPRVKFFHTPLSNAENEISSPVNGWAKTAKP